jgi:HD-GYP domain-containing protein (c-di-GMP phosphodiesterase class II)
MTRPLNLLLVEDQESDAELVVLELMRAGFDPIAQRVDTERDYLAALSTNLDIILADYNLPQFNGLRALELLAESKLDVPLIIVSGSIGEELATTAIRQGAADYLLKDRPARLGLAVTNALEQRRLRREKERADADLRASEEHFRASADGSFDAFYILQSVREQSGEIVDFTFIDLNRRAEGQFNRSRENLMGQQLCALFPNYRGGLFEKYRLVADSGQAYDDEIELTQANHPSSWLHLQVVPLENGVAVTSRDVTERRRSEQELRDAHAELEHAYDATLEGWSKALSLRDQETELHTARVVDVTIELAKSLGMTGDQLVNVRRGALLHDIGKMGIPDSILLKPGPLTEYEWEIMRLHPSYAHQMLSPIDYLRPALEIPLCHHEKWDGSGYPRGLRGEEIPLAARIFAVVDVWDALSFNRPYRPAWPPEQVLEHIQQQANSHFDPVVVTAFLALAEAQPHLFRRGTSSKP